MKSIKFLFLAVVGSLVLSSCSDDDKTPEQINEEEVITTVVVTLKEGENTVILKSLDADGDGKDPVNTITGNLKPGVTYTGSIELYNETESPKEDITEEVKEEGKEHQFFYTASNNIATFKYDTKNVDENGNPIGLNFTMTTTEAQTSGNLTFILRHEPNKTGKNVKEGDITNAAGETDVEVTFEVTTK